MPGWWLSLCVEAREAGGCFVSTIQPDRTMRFDDEDRVPDLERSAAEAARRARRQVRLFCVANGLNRLGTLTYAVEPDLRQIRADLGRFFVRLRRELGGEAFPYLWVVERGEKKGRLHAHFAVGRWIGRQAIVSAWDHGFVHIKLIGDLPVGSGAVGEARRVARYLAPYASKNPAAGSGLHRYEVAQGFQPRIVKVWGRTAPEAIKAASVLLGCDPEYEWNSDQVEGWAGPPAVWASWPG